MSRRDVHVVASRNELWPHLGWNATHCTCGHVSTGREVAGADLEHDRHVRRMIERALAKAPA